MIDDETWRKMWKLISADVEPLLEAIATINDPRMLDTIEDVELHTFGRITVRRHILRRRGELK